MSRTLIRGGMLPQAVSTGVIRHLRRDDYICSTYRDHVHALSKDVPAREIMAELFGKKTGICRGQGGSMHMFSSKYNLVRPFAHARPLFHCNCSTPGKFLQPRGLALAAARVQSCIHSAPSILWLQGLIPQAPLCRLPQPRADLSGLVAAT